MRVLAVAFLLSGSAGLIHEVVWARLLGHLFGGTSLAVTTVLAAFMGGLAAGSYAAGMFAERIADRRRAYAFLEIGIGVAALLIPLALDAIEPLYGWLWRRYQWSFAVFSVLRFVIAGALLLPPTAMMGATLPLLADYLAGENGRRLPPQWLYTLNLAGAIFGAAAAGFVLMPALGVWGTILAGAAVNVGVGVAVLRLPAAAAAPAPAALAGVDSAPDRPAVSAVLLLAAFLSGLLSLSTQVAWTRVLALIVGSTTYAFTMVLVVYLTALGLGSAWASRRGARVADVRPELAVMHFLLALTLTAAVFCINRLPHWYLGLYHIWQPENLAGVIAMSSMLVFAILLPPVLCAGTILPFCLIGALPPESRGTGRAVGVVYGVNTVGSIAGAVLAGFVLIPDLGTQRTLLGVAFAAAATGGVVALTRRGQMGLAIAAAGTLALVGVAFVNRPAVNFSELHSGVFEIFRIDPNGEAALTEPGEHMLFEREGATASVYVLEIEGGDRGLMINGRSNASTVPSDMATQVLLAQLPLLLAPRAEDVLIIGWGSGITVGSALKSGVEKVTAVELEPAVIEASTYFSDFNYEPQKNERLRLFVDDARHLLLASDDTYDVIISEPAHFWVSGVANLFTQEFYRMAERRLRDDGIFEQWVQGYQIAFDNIRSIIATYQSVFPQVTLFSPPLAGDLLLVGSRHPLKLDLAELEQRWKGGIASELARIDIERPEHLLATFYADNEAMRKLGEGATINTDDNMYVEFRAPRDMIAAQSYGAARSIFADLEKSATPIEKILTDPTAITQNRDRLEAVLEGLHDMPRPAKRYERMLEGLPES